MSFTEETQFDGFLGNIIERAGGIEPFIDVIFSFLSRRTNFFTPTSENSHLPRDTILKSFDTYKKKALDLEAERKKQQDQTVNKQKTQTSRKPVSSQPKVEMHPQVEDVDEGTLASKSDTIPVGNGGVTERYTWTQTLPIVDVYVKVPPGTTSRRCNIVIAHDHLRIEVNNIVYLDGKLHDKVKPQECMWTLEDQKLIHVVLEKLDGMKWWNCVIQGDPQIDTQKIVPENSKLSDLDPELRQTVEKMMFDQEQKAKGLPSSDQLHQAELLEKFKKAHPEMDFSKAKICNSNSFGNGNFQF